MILRFGCFCSKATVCSVKKWEKNRREILLALNALQLLKTLTRENIFGNLQFTERNSIIIARNFVSILKSLLRCQNFHSEDVEVLLIGVATHC